MAHLDLAYDKLPGAIKDNLSPAQWEEAQRDVIAEGDAVPETTVYVDVKNGQCRAYQAGELASGPLLPAHDLSGGGGADDTQFHTMPRGAQTPT